MVQFQQFYDFLVAQSELIIQMAYKNQKSFSRPFFQKSVGYNYMYVGGGKVQKMGSENKNWAEHIIWKTKLSENKTKFEIGRTVRKLLSFKELLSNLGEMGLFW